MKLKKTLLASLICLPTTALLVASCSALPQLNNLKRLIKKSSTQTLLEGVDIVIHPLPAEELENGKKQIAREDVKKYEEVLEKAKSVKTEKAAAQAIKELENAIQNLEAAIVVGTKGADSTTPKLDSLKTYVATVTIEILLKDVTKVEKVKPKEEILQGVKQIANKAVEEYRKVLEKASAFKDEGKADEMKKELEKAVEKLLSSIVVGIKTKTKLDLFKEYIASVEVNALKANGILKDVEIVNAPVEPKDLQKGKKVIEEQYVTKYGQEVEKAKLVSKEEEVDKAKQDLQDALATLESSIVVGIKE
ncbi:hypothetical protein JN00_0578 [Metamycoplasma subdolum]|uniref:Lipoprotein n=2 Tax=Metamycoplasma subdolum TaxID=92407 RepID=A0A3L9ZXH6_9BACT|nr:hypothetical protein [Metamycoplasma subdolum]RMA77413.1 hypothetical protein JN00_0578 [Metamycoplasma subdolum]WPB50410.1 hypothetical protein R9C05_02285 [Metamycoplasma subdolum]